MIVQSISWTCAAAIGWLILALSGAGIAHADDSGELPARCPVEIGGQVFHVDSFKMFGGDGPDRKGWNPAQICAAKSAPRLASVVISQWAQTPDAAALDPSPDPFSITLNQCPKFCIDDFNSIVRDAHDLAAQANSVYAGQPYIGLPPDRRLNNSRWFRYYFVYRTSDQGQDAPFLVTCGVSAAEFDEERGYCHLRFLFQDTVFVDIRFNVKFRARSQWLILYRRAATLIREMSVNH